MIKLLQKVKVVGSSSPIFIQKITQVYKYGQRKNEKLTLFTAPGHRLIVQVWSLAISNMCGNLCNLASTELFRFIEWPQFFMFYSFKSRFMLNPQPPDFSQIHHSWENDFLNLTKSQLNSLITKGVQLKQHGNTNAVNLKWLHKEECKGKKPKLRTSKRCRRDVLTSPLERCYVWGTVVVERLQSISPVQLRPVQSSSFVLI